MPVTIMQPAHGIHVCCFLGGEEVGKYPDEVGPVLQNGHHTSVDLTGARPAHSGRRRSHCTGSVCTHLLRRPLELLGLQQCLQELVVYLRGTGQLGLHSRSRDRGSIAHVHVRTCVCAAAHLDLCDVAVQELGCSIRGLGGGRGGGTTRQAMINTHMHAHTMWQGITHFQASSCQHCHHLLSLLALFGGFPTSNYLSDHHGLHPACTGRLTPSPPWPSNVLPLTPSQQTVRCR